MSQPATNRYERGLLWVLTHHGEEGALAALEPGVADAFGAVWKDTEGEADAAHHGPPRRRPSSGPDAGVAATVAGSRKATSAESCIPKVCRSTSPDGLDAAVELAIQRPVPFFTLFGAWLLGRALQRSDRREVARCAGALSDEPRGALSEGYRDRRPLGDDEARRVREVFERFVRHTDRIEDAIYRLGMFGMATACVRRFRQRLHRLAGGLDRREGDRCLHYYHRAWSSSRRGVEAAFRATLVAFTGWYQLRRGGDD